MRAARAITTRKGYELSPDIPNIFEAARDNNLNDLNIALQHVDVNILNKKGMTPLHYAAGNLSSDAVNRLLAEPGIDPTIEDIYGRTASSIPLEVWGDNPEAVMFSDSLRPYCYPGEWQEFDQNNRENGFF